MAEGWLKEVEEDATYITNKRIQEHHEEQQRVLQKQQQAEAKAKAKDNKEGK